MHNKNAIRVFSVSERLSNSRIKRFVSYTQAPSFNRQFSIFNCKTVLASCTTSVYVNLSKNSFFHAPTQNFDSPSRKLTAIGKPQIHLVLHSLAKFLRESGCKGTKNINTNQTFKHKNSQKHESFREC